VDTSQVADNAITDAKLRDGGACSVIGRSANSSGDPADISASTNGTFLGRRGDALSFLSPKTSELTSHSAFVYRSGSASTQTVSVTTQTAILYDAEYFDTDSYHSTSSNTSRLTAPVAGKYLVGGYVSMQDHSGYQQLAIRKNGSSYLYVDQQSKGAGLGFGIMNSVVGLVELSATDYVELVVYHNIVGGRTVSGSSFFILHLGA